METTRELNALTLADGAIIEKLNLEIQRVVQNIADINADPKKKRKIVLTLVFAPKANGYVPVEIKADSTLAPYNPCEANIYVGKDDDDNSVGREIVLKQQEIPFEDSNITHIRGVK